MKDIVNSVKKMIESEKLAGVREVCLPGGRIESQSRGGKCVKPSGNAEKAVKDNDLESLKAEVMCCLRCPLAETRTNVVFGEGNIKADLMFIGEAPGRDEDEQGRPFVGRAGQLLTKIIESIGLKREDVYIANILKCRPPDNRNPLPGEIAACSPQLIRQIELIKPKVICALGKFSAQTLLASETSISSLRGKFHDYRGVKLMPTYHPAYLLRNSGGKKDVWADMQLIAKELGIQVPLKKKT
ncbi:MAG: uracil-DNA glycosylase [Candidatus Omnitrophota bacterium]